jgi:hypothetical protein
MKISRLLKTIFTVSLRGAKRRSNLVFKGKNGIATLPMVARNDKTVNFSTTYGCKINTIKEERRNG